MEGVCATAFIESETAETFFDNSYELIRFDDSLELRDCCHVAHCCIYCLHSFPTVHIKESKAFISMQLRFDGRLGFPGGCIDKNESVTNGLNRELNEEINLDKKYFISRSNHCVSSTNKEKDRCYHFFTKEVSMDNFLEIERNALNAEDFGLEVLGLIRVPLYTLDDGIGGFPAFLSNSFAGCAKYQLLHFLCYSKLMSYDDIKECLSRSVS